MRSRMRVISIAVFVILSGVVGTCFCFAAQGEGVYHIVDPEGKSLNEFGWSTLGKIIGDSIRNISIIEYYGRWTDENEAKEQLIKILHNKEREISSAPLWNMDMPVQVIAMIDYVDGHKGKVAVVAEYRVGFQLAFRTF